MISLFYLIEIVKEAPANKMEVAHIWICKNKTPTEIFCQVYRKEYERVMPKDLIQGI